MPHLTACTIADTGSLSHARVLAQSFQTHHPGATFTILLTDAFTLQSPDPALPVLSLNDLSLSPDYADRLPKRYATDELRRALKPWLLRQQLSSGADCAMYFDPTIEVLAPLSDVCELLHDADVILAERCGSAEEHDTVLDAAERLRFEPGFVALGRESEPVLEWWMTAVSEDVAAERSIDRALLDRVPPSFRTHVLTGGGWNVGYWNLPRRTLAVSEDRYAVNGEAVRFFNFSGYEIEKPHLLSRHQGHDPRVLLSESPALEKLCRDYHQQLTAAAAGELQRSPHGIGRLPSGLRIDRHIHRLYTDARARCESKAGPEPPDAFSPRGTPAFLKWLNQRMMDGRPEITRYMLALHGARPDLQRAFPEPLGQHADLFQRWFLSCGITEENVPPDLFPNDAPLEPVAVRETNQENQIPINVVGYFKAELGVGEAARLLVSALDAAAIPFTTTGYHATANRQEHPFEHAPDLSGDADIEIVCINADQLPGFVETAGASAQRDRYRIGVWFWEVDEFPTSLENAFALVDEVWVASVFVQRAISKVSPKPVFKFHLPVDRPAIDRALTRSSLQIPVRFCFLFSFDLLSVLERKNPLGLITAFQRAFRPGEGPVLVLKTINGEHRVREMEKLKFAIAGHPDITLLDGYLSQLEKNTLTALCDCYVSLHRSEGFGLTMAEAMALGKPVIATGYSGNMEFMNDANSFLCHFAQATVGPGCEPYPGHAHWAEPDLAHAAELMREVFLHPAEARARGQRAADEILGLHAPQIAGRAVAERLRAIRRHRSGR